MVKIIFEELGGKYRKMLMVKPYIFPKRVKTESIGEIILIQSSF